LADTVEKGRKPKSRETISRASIAMSKDDSKTAAVLESLFRASDHCACRAGFFNTIGT
jgi:hypothetical protein